MANLESVIATLKEYTQVTENDNVPAYVVKPLTEKRSDRFLQIETEGNQLRTTKKGERNAQGTQLEVFTTTNPVPHTTVRVDKTSFLTNLNTSFHPEAAEVTPEQISLLDQYPDGIPLHLITWWSKIDDKGNNDPVVFPSAKNFSEKDITELSKLIASNTMRSAKALSEAAPHEVANSNIPFYKRIRTYGLFGHSKSRLNRGAQSNENGHLHTVYLPEEVLNDEPQLTEDLPLEKVLKQMSPFDGLIFAHSKNAVIRRLRKQGLDVEPIMDHSKNENNRVSFLDGYVLNFNNIPLDEALRTVWRVVAEAEPLYEQLLQKYTQYYQNLSNPENQEVVITQAIQQLRDYGFTPEEAETMQKSVFSLAPTLGQINLWLAEITNGTNKVKLSEMKTRYERQKTTLADPIKRVKMVDAFSRRHGITLRQAQELVVFIEDRLKDQSLGENPTLTMTGKLSGGYLLQYSDINMMVSRIILATRFSQKSILEDEAGIALIRDDSLFSYPILT